MTIHEKYGAGAVTGNDQQATVAFWLTGHNAWADAYDELYSASVGNTTGTTPDYSGFNGIPAQSVDVDEVAEWRGYFNGTVNYGYDTPRGNDPDGTPKPELEFSFDTSVRPRLERWLSDGTGWTEISKTGATGYTPVSRDGLAWGGKERGYQGIEVPRPDTAFNIEYSPLTLTQGELVAISAAVGKVNQLGFYGYQPGEVLFAGAQGQSKKNDRWRLSYQFLAKANRTNINCGNGIIIAAADGWDVIEVEHVKTTIDLGGGKEGFTEKARQARVMRPFTRLNLAPVIFP